MPHVTDEDREVQTHQLGTQILLIDKQPETEVHKIMVQLKKTFDWSNVAKLHISDTNVNNFMKTLHRLDSEKVEFCKTWLGKGEPKPEEN